MADVVYKERSQYLKKANIVGDERIVVNGQEFITPSQILEFGGIKSGRKLITSSDIANTANPGVVRTSGSRTTPISPEPPTSTPSRFYGVEVDSEGKMFVNVPWEGGGGSTMNIADIFRKMQGVAPRLELRRGNGNAGDYDLITCKHRAYDYLPYPKCEFVLMVYTKKNNRKSKRDTNIHRKKGWSVAKGWAGDRTLSSRSQKFEVSKIRDYIVKNYMTMNGYSRAQMERISYSEFIETKHKTLDGFGTSTTSPKSVKIFGIALRYPNPDFENAMIEGHTNGEHCQDIRRYPRYIYSEVAEMRVVYHYSGGEDHLDFAFIR